MGTSVVFETETLAGIVEIGSTNEPAAFVVQGHLRLGPRQSREHEEKSQPRFHR